MFTPIRTPEPRNHSPKNRSVGKPDPNSLSSPIDVASLSVQRFRSMVTTGEHKVDRRDPVVAAGIAMRRGGAATSVAASSPIAGGRLTHSSSASSPSATKRSSLAIHSPFLVRHREQQQQQQQQRGHQIEPPSLTQKEEEKEEEEEESIDQMAQDLSTLLGGAPIPRIFHQVMQSRLNLNDGLSSTIKKKSDGDAAGAASDISAAVPAAAAAAAISPVPMMRHEEKDDHSHRHEGDVSRSVSLSAHHARFLDEELHLKLRHERAQKQAASSASRRRSSPDDSEDTPTISATVAGSARDIGYQLADRLGNKFGPLLRGVVDVLSKFGSEQQTAAGHAQYERHAVKQQLLEAQKNSSGNEKASSAEAAKLAAAEAAAAAAAAANADEPEDIEAERKRLLAQVATYQSKLLSEREALAACRRSNDDLKEQLQDQFVSANIRNDEYRALQRAAEERFNELERAFQEKKLEIKNLQAVVKAQESDIEERVWVSTIEVESTAVRETMLRKHCKDVETRTAVLASRLRLEQDMTHKLRMKLVEVLEKKQQQQQQQEAGEGEEGLAATTTTTTTTSSGKLPDEILHDYLGGVVPVPSATTPRPDKAQLCKAVPALGKAHESSSTVALVDALVSLNHSLGARLKAEERSMVAAQEEADRVLNERRNRAFAEVEAQTEPVAGLAPLPASLVAAAKEEDL